MTQPNAETPTPSESDPDRTGGVGEHVLESPSSGDVDHLKGEFGELDKELEPDGGDQRTSGTQGEGSPDTDGP